MIISLMVAYSKNLAIGKDNKLLWHLSDDLKNFKKYTLNKYIVMGRKTYESIGFPLPKRTTIIVTRNPEYKAEGCIVVGSIDEAIAVANKDNQGEVVITGGGEIYKQSLELINAAYITEVDCEIKEADAFFPKIDFSTWTKDSEGSYSFSKDEKNEYDWDFSIYRK